LEYYKRVEPTAAPRDVALEVDKDHTQRLKFSCQNGHGNVSNAIWSMLLSNPDLEGLRKIMSWLQTESSLPEVGVLRGTVMGDDGPVAFGTKVITPGQTPFV
jgi:hypothetical protein